MKKRWWAGVRHFFRIGRVQWSMLASFMWIWFRRKIRLPHKQAKLDRIHKRHAVRFKRAATDLKGANIKVCQLASLQAHILPKAYIEEFKTLRDEVEPTDYALIAEVVRSELGKDPTELFASFDETPIAAASMAQVHRATLKTGEDVVVKILYPGLERSVAIDLWLTRRMVGVLRWIFRKIDLRQIYKEAEAPLLEELDLAREGRSTEELAVSLAEIDVIVPKVYWEFTARRVLTLEYIEGTKLDNLEQMEAWGIDRKALILSYIRAFFRQAFEGDFFHCDPHPANALCTPDGRLALLDFGMVKRIPDHVRIGLVKEILGGFFNNATLYADGIIERGIVQESDRETLEAFARKTFTDDNLRSVIFDHELQRKGDLLMVLDKVKDLVHSLKTFRTPQDQLMFLRALGIVIDVTREVYPEEPLSTLCLPLLMPVFMRFLQEHPQYMEWATTVFAAQAAKNAEAAAVNASQTEPATPALAEIEAQRVSESQT
jgi:predicted unusual protein kinase regulating ubiquinone biosynthesis (AarF/ABC1/UbiB family)